MTFISSLLNNAFSAREAFLDEKRETAFRLFNGFLEGDPTLSVDIYGRTALIHNYAVSPAEIQAASAQSWVINNLPWVKCIILKTRSVESQTQKRGVIVHGTTPDDKVREHGVWYAIDLMMNQDSSLYLDTRNLRLWCQEMLGGKSVLNTFAYTGSLGVAALAGGASHVVQLDRNRSSLNLSQTSCTLNGFANSLNKLMTSDFFPAVGHLKHSGQRFDCVFLDPPFFATTSRGIVDLEFGITRLINKVRPLVNHGGWLVSINNALFVSGKDYLSSLDALCADGYLSIEELIPIPEDFSGFPKTKVASPPVDPSPFNHSTKIAILRVKRKLTSLV